MAADAVAIVDGAEFRLTYTYIVSRRPQDDLHPTQSGQSSQPSQASVYRLRLVANRIGENCRKPAELTDQGLPYSQIRQPRELFSTA